MNSLMSCCTAAVGQEHGRRTLPAWLGNKESTERIKIYTESAYHMKTNTISGFFFSCIRLTVECVGLFSWK